MGTSEAPAAAAATVGRDHQRQSVAAKQGPTTEVHSHSKLKPSTSRISKCLT
jgi:hypothetical protein